MKYALVLFAALSACAEAIPRQTVEVKAVAASSDLGLAAVRGTLKDPWSAQFRSPAVYRIADGQTVYCGEVNAKNSFGGYTGWTPYYVRARDGKVVRAIAHEIAGTPCLQARAGKIENVTVD